MSTVLSLVLTVAFEICPLSSWVRKSAKVFGRSCGPGLINFWAKNAKTTTMRMGKAALLKKRLIARGYPGCYRDGQAYQHPGGVPAEFCSGLQRGHERQVAVALGEIQPVADGELVRDLESDVAREHLDLAPLRLGEQRADLQRGRVAGPQVAHQVLQCEPGVDDVLDDEDVASLDRRVE